MRTFKLIADRVEIASLDASAMMNIDTFYLRKYAIKFMEEHGYTDRSKYGYEADYNTYIVHVYALTMREVEL